MCDRAYYWVCVLVKDIGRRLPLELHQRSLYQDQQGDVNQSMRGKYKTRFLAGQNLTGVEGNASVYQVYPVSRTTDERRADILRRGGRGRGGGSICAAALNP